MKESGFKLLEWRYPDPTEAPVSWFASRMCKVGEDQGSFHFIIDPFRKYGSGSDHPNKKKLNNKKDLDLGVQNGSGSGQTEKGRISFLEFDKNIRIRIYNSGLQGKYKNGVQFGAH